MTAKIKKEIEISMKNKTLSWLKSFEKSKKILSSEEQITKQQETLQAHQDFFNMIDECDEHDFILFVCYPILENIKTQHSKNSEAGIPQFFRTLKTNLKATASYQNKDEEQENLYESTYDLFQERILEIQDSPVSNALLRKCYRDVQLTTLVTSYDTFIRIITLKKNQTIF